MAHIVLVMLAAAFMCVALLESVAAEPLRSSGFKMAGDASRMRLVVQFDREPEVHWRLLRNPHRLVLDVPRTNFRFDRDDLEPRGMVTRVMHGNLDSDTSRIILSADGPFAVERIQAMKNESSEGYRLVADFVAASEDAFEAALVDQIDATGSTALSTPKSGRLPEQGSASDGFVIVVDAGHGGIDSGARGGTGTLEKTITLAFSLELKARLEAIDGYEVVLTRDRDVFLRLDERVGIARRHEADLFISVHADAIRLNSLRGATVYTGAERASDATAAAKAIRENLSDQVAGIETDDRVQPVADILVDLIRRETQRFSIRFARSLVGELSTDIKMVNNPHRFAGFRVLTAPDVPSVLLELGYLSNGSDERQLRDPQWRGQAIEAIVGAVNTFAAESIGTGG